MPKAILQFKLKFLVIEVPDTTWPMLIAQDFFLPNKLLYVALMTHHSTGSVRMYLICHVHEKGGHWPCLGPR